MVDVSDRTSPYDCASVSSDGGVYVSEICPVVLAYVSFSPVVGEVAVLHSTVGTVPVHCSSGSPCGVVDEYCMNQPSVVCSGLPVDCSTVEACSVVYEVAPCEVGVVTVNCG